MGIHFFRSKNDGSSACYLDLPIRFYINLKGIVFNQLSKRLHVLFKVKSIKILTTNLHLLWKEYLVTYCTKTSQKIPGSVYNEIMLQYSSMMVYIKYVIHTCTYGILSLSIVYVHITLRQQLINKIPHF